MTNEMIERCARALAALRIRTVRRWDTPGDEIEAMLPASIEHAWRDHVREARAVLKELMEPTSEMVDAGRYAVCSEFDEWGETIDPVRDCWTAMLTKALEENP